MMCPKPAKEKMQALGCNTHTKCNLKMWKAKGSKGWQWWQQVTTGGHGGSGKQEEATGSNGRQREATGGNGISFENNIINNLQELSSNVTKHVMKNGKRVPNMKFKLKKHVMKKKEK